MRGLDAGRRGQLEQYVRAWETADVGALTSLLLAEASFSMPPTPAWYRGRDEVDLYELRHACARPLLTTRA